MIVMTHQFFLFLLTNSLDHRTPESHECSHFSLSDVSITVINNIVFMIMTVNAPHPSTQANASIPVKSLEN